VLLDRDVLLSEQLPRAFAEEHGLHLFPEDDVAVNRSIQFKIEMFEPTEKFNPSRPYKTRLKWSDANGGDQSKLLVTALEAVIAGLLEAKVNTPAESKPAARRPARARRGSARMDASRG
jgi:hypothetical protein